MSGEPTISIKIAEMGQDNLKNLAKAADSDGSGTIDTAYELSLFKSYCDAAGEDSSDYNAKYTASDTQKAEKTLVKEQKYKDGSVKSNVANLEQYESKWQGAMKFAFKAVGNDPESKAKLCEFIKTKPKLQDFTSMGDYAVALGEKINEMSNLFEIDLKTFTEEIVNSAVDKVNTNVTERADKIDSSLSQIQQELADGTAKIIKTVNGSAGRIIKTIETSKGEIMQFIFDENNTILSQIYYTGEEIKDNDNWNTYTVHEHLDEVDNNVKDEAEATREVVKNEAEATRDFDTRTKEISNAIATNQARFLRGGVDEKEVKKIGELQTKIINSNLSQSNKDYFLQKLLEVAQADHFNVLRLEQLDYQLNKAINK